MVEEEEEEDEEEDYPIGEIGRSRGHIGWAEGEDVRPDEDDVGRDRLDITNRFLGKEVWARGHSAIRAKGERSLGYQFTQIENTRVRHCGGPLFIGPMGLGIRNVESISTVRSLRSNGPQIPPPKKPLINARHVAPYKVASRHLGHVIPRIMEQSHDQGRPTDIHHKLIRHI